ncbi:hypothetical protein Vretifemale_20975 [Volvox reticuliferus]|uniref:Uncharacterized protein n=1 Tax=Volvox reticuliferus TaxID=1737510 RepID=A0A8J4D251_9CHLO|nr:hypothetical protein Vretifemale_20975 [Volvox reticuliferus]
MGGARVYVGSRRFLREYPDIAGYVRDLYSVSRNIPCGEHGPHQDALLHFPPALNCYAVIPRGGAAWWTEPSSRAERFGGGEAYEAAVEWQSQPLSRDRWRFSFLPLPDFM